MASLTISSVTLLMLGCTLPTVTPRNVEQLPITCDAEECSIGESASVTCHFGTDIRQNRRHFAVVMYPFHVEKSFSGIDVLRCHWTQPSSPECRVMDGFVFDQHITDTITVNISKATTQMAGTYACELVPSNDRTKRTCNFNVRERSQSAALLQSAPRRPPLKDSNERSLLAMNGITIFSLVLLITLNVFLVIAIRRSWRVIEKWRNTDSEPKRIKGYTGLPQQPPTEEEVASHSAKPAGSGDVKQRTPNKSKSHPGHTNDRRCALQGKLLQLINH